MSLDPQGHYARLGVEPWATPAEIVAAFRRKARVLHPDVPGTGNAAAFVAVKLAYDVLADPSRRDAYDRSARVPPPEVREPGEIEPPPRPPMAPIPTRQPRLSDLPMFVWAGMAAILAIGVLEVALHLWPSDGAGAPRREIRPNAPVVAPASPALAHNLAFGPAPVQLPGSANYYITPTASPAMLWRYDAAHQTLVPQAALPPFSSVQALRLYRQNGMVEVRVTASTTGFIEAAHLSPGDLTTAHRGYCAYNAGTTPSNGEVLSRHGSGSGHLPIDNRSSEPAVIKLRDRSGHVAASVFVAPGEHVELDGLPDTTYRADFAIGELWSRACNGFAAGMRAQRMRGFHSLQALTPLAVPPDLPGEPPPADIPDHVFDQE